MNLPYEMGEMRSESGKVIRWTVEPQARELALKIVDILSRRPLYGELKCFWRSDRFDLYCERLVRDAIYPQVQKLCFAQWFLTRGEEIPPDLNPIYATNTPIMNLLAAVWPDEQVEFILVREARVKSVVRSVLNSVKAPLKKMRNRVRAKFEPEVEPMANRQRLEPTIAVLNVEGVDLERRSDIVWFPASGIKPDNVLFYIDDNPFSIEDKKTLEAYEMDWVDLRQPDLAHRLETGTLVGLPQEAKADTGQRDQVRGLDWWADDWIRQEAQELNGLIRRWLSFYELYNVRIQFIAEEGFAHNIAQAIALDYSGYGLLIGKQRSELFQPAGTQMGYYPRDVFFLWNVRACSRLRSNGDRIRFGVVTGHPNDQSFQNSAKKTGEELRGKVANNGAEYVVAFFDNMHSPELHFSTKSMCALYEALLNKVLDDVSFGLLIKSKKPLVLDTLPSVQPLLEAAIKTGRCIKLDNEFGRIPSDASQGADIAIGVGISSAVVEAVLAGCRGLHYDMTKLRDHEFYEWGNDRLIFDDLNCMMQALDNAKEKKTGFLDLGVWDEYLDELDPFRDGCAAERIGAYLKWCLDGFEKGLGRLDAMERANKRYADIWGADKVVAL